MDQFRQRLSGGAKPHRQRQLGDQVGCIGTDDVPAKNTTIARVDQYLDESVALAEAKRLAVRPEVEPPDAHLAALRCGDALAEADGSYLRRRVDAGWHSTVVYRPGAPQGVLSGRSPLSKRDMSQELPADDVTGCVNPLNARRIAATSLSFLCRSMDDTADVVFPYLLIYDLQTRQHSRARVYLPMTTGVSLGNPDGARFSTLTSVSATEDELRLGLKSHTVFTVPPATTVFDHDKSEFIVELPGLAADPQLSLPRQIDAQGSVLKSVLVESGTGDAARTGISVRVALDPAKRDRITYTAEERPAEDGQGVVVIFQFSDQEPATDLSPAYPR